MIFKKCDASHAGVGQRFAAHEGEARVLITLAAQRDTQYPGNVRLQSYAAAFSLEFAAQGCPIAHPADFTNIRLKYPVYGVLVLA
jgi:hypothetical protein